MFKLADLHFQLNWCEMAKEHQVHKNGLKKLVCGKIFSHLFKEFEYFLQFVLIFEKNGAKIDDSCKEFG